MAETFTKHYPDADRCTAAATHHRWFRDLGAPVPALVDIQPHALVLAHVSGTHCGIPDIPAVASLLGRLHAQAYNRELHAAQMDRPFRIRDRTLMDAFVQPRITALERRRRSGTLRRQEQEFAAAVVTRAADQPAAVYKDTNIRNVLLSPGSGPQLLDFDDLTLAPFGYDLAKLLLSAAMTYGPLPPKVHRQALATYQQAVQEHGGPATPCPWEDFTDWLTLHAALTSNYLGHNGYRHRWAGLDY